MSIYEEALNILEADGWCQGSYTNTAGCHCVVGALYKAETGKGSPSYAENGKPVLDAAKFLNGLLRDQGKVMSYEEAIAWSEENPGQEWPATSIIDWNDHHERTYEEVRKLLEEADRAASAA